MDIRRLDRAVLLPHVLARAARPELAPPGRLCRDDGGAPRLAALWLPVADDGTPGESALLLYSSSNIAGCALALLGPVLLFAGFIGKGWLPVTAGLYVVGWLLARCSPASERQIEANLSAQQTHDQLDRVIAGARPYLSAEMQTHVTSIRSSVSEVLPRLLADRGQGDELFTVRETVLSYLPETLANYAALPKVFRTRHVFANGRTASDQLIEQLALLDKKLREVVVNAAASDAQALLANGRFLQASSTSRTFLRVDAALADAARTQWRSVADQLRGKFPKLGGG